MNVTYYLKITKKCKITGLTLVSVETNECGEILFLNDSHDANAAKATCEDDLARFGDYDSVVTRVRMVDEYVVAS